MRAIKLLHLCMIGLMWWLTINGYHSTPVDRRWFVFLLGTSIGFVLGCLDSRYTYHKEDAWWHFPNDMFWMIIGAFFSSAIVDYQLGSSGIGFLFGGGILLSFTYIAWPREEA